MSIHGHGASLGPKVYESGPHPVFQASGKSRNPTGNQNCAGQERRRLEVLRGKPAPTTTITFPIQI